MATLSDKAKALEAFIRRRLDRLEFWLDAPEPQSKKAMRESDRRLFQTGVLNGLNALRKKPPRGLIALRMDFATSAKNPPHAQTVAKNVLDLLEKPLPGVANHLDGILYTNDNNVRALCVSCTHGHEAPSTFIELRTMAAMRRDLKLAATASQELDMSHEGYMRSEQDSDDIERFKKLRSREDDYTSMFGEEGQAALTQLAQRAAQAAILRKSKADPAHLWWLYNPEDDLMGVWSELFFKTPLRLQLKNLPTREGGSDVFRAEIDAAIAAFKAKWEWLIQPLRIAVGLQIVVKPPHDMPKGTLHDLDNIVRDYLLPRIVPEFNTVSDSRFTIDFERLAVINPDLHASFGEQLMPPKGTRDGVTHYEAWRLPKAKAGEEGFVSVALVPGADHDNDAFQEIDERVKRWAKKT